MRERSWRTVSASCEKTARSCVGYRTCHPNRVMFSNPSVALADCPAPQSSFRLAFNGRAYWHRASMARPLNHHPATEAGAAPFARWLHKSGSHSNQAADLSKRSTSLTSYIIMLSRKSTSPRETRIERVVRERPETRDGWTG